MLQMGYDGIHGNERLRSNHMPDDYDHHGCQEDADREPRDCDDDEERDRKPEHCSVCGWTYDGHKPGCPEDD